MNLDNDTIIYLKKLYLQFGMNKINWNPYFHDDAISFNLS